ncbi:MAG: ATP-binding protein, partial [Bacteroidota bacterium]
LFLIDLIAIFSVVTIRGQYKHEFERFKAVKQVEAKERELKIAVEKLATANSDLKSFNRSISHDLKTPVRNAISFTQLLLREIKNPSSKAEDYGDFILNSLQKMNSLINSLFEFSKIGHRSLQKTTVDLVRLAREAYEEQLILRNRDERNITFILEDLPSLVADPVLIGGVMNNLISNAIKYSSKKPHSIVEVGAYRNGSEYTIYVKDNGVGFNQKQYDKKVFQIFKRLHTDHEFEGSGIGLSIVERIIQKHGGRIWAESEIGKGATFYFTLPVQQSMAA